MIFSVASNPFKYVFTEFKLPNIQRNPTFRIIFKQITSFKRKQFYNWGLGFLFKIWVPGNNRSVLGHRRDLWLPNGFWRPRKSLRTTMKYITITDEKVSKLRTQNTQSNLEYVTKYATKIRISLVGLHKLSVCFRSKYKSIPSISGI